MRSEEDVTKTIQQYSDTVKRLCLVHLKNYEDTQDIFQNVFFKYACCDTYFESEEHKKAWLIRVTINACKDLLKSFFHSHTMPLDSLAELSYTIEEDNKDVLQQVLKLPEKYRRVIYLHYYEGYTAVEISKLINKNVNTIYTLLKRGKEMLKETLGGEYGGR